MNLKSSFSWRAVSWVFILIFFGKITGFIRELYISYEFGASKSTDAYFVASNIPNLLFLSIIGSLLAFVIPKIEEIKSKGLSIDNFVNSFISIVLVLSLSLSLIGTICADFIIELIAPGFNEETKNYAVELSRILVWSFPFSSLCLILAYISSTFGKLFSQHLIPVTSNILVVLGIILFADKYGIKIVAIAGVLAILIQLIVQILLSRQYLEVKLNFDLLNKDNRHIIVLAIPFFLTNSLEQINSFVNTYIASEFIVGSVSHLNYAQKVQLTLNSTISLAIITVSYPLLSRFYYSFDKQEFYTILQRTLDVVVLSTSLITLILIVYGYEFINFIFLRGNFTQKDVEITSQIFIYYSLGILSISIREILLRIYLIRKDAKTPLIISAITIIINIFLSILLVEKFGIKSMAIANSVSILMNLIVMIYFLPEIKKLNFSEILKKTVIPVVCSGFIVLCFKNFFTATINPVLGAGLISIILFVFLLFFQNPLLLMIKAKLNG